MGWWDTPEAVSIPGVGRAKGKGLVASHEERGFQHEWSHSQGGCVKWGESGSEREGKEMPFFLSHSCTSCWLNVPRSQRAGELGKVALCDKSRAENILRVYKISWDTLLTLKRRG